MSTDLLKLVGEQIRTLRKEKGLTQDELAEKAQIHNRYISNIERAARNITVETLGKVLVALDVTPFTFFQFQHIDSIEDSIDKKTLIGIFNLLLEERSVEEVQMIFRVAKDILSTYDNKK